MHAKLSRLACGATLLLLLGTNTAFASINLIEIEHDWMFVYQGGRYGLVEYHDDRIGNFTEICFGSLTYDTSFTAWQIVGGGAGLLVILLTLIAFACSAFLRPARHRSSPPSEVSR